jgi:hypothetical protein
VPGLSFIEADPRQGRVREQTERNEPVARRPAPASQVIADNPKVVLGHVGELGAAGTLPNRPDLRRTRLEAVVNLYIAPFIEPYARDVQSNPRGIGSASRRGQDVAAFDEPLALRRPHAEADALSGPPFDLERLGRKENLDPFVGE